MDVSCSPKFNGLNMSGDFDQRNSLLNFSPYSQCQKKKESDFTSFGHNSINGGRIRETASDKVSGRVPKSLAIHFPKISHQNHQERGHGSNPDRSQKFGNTDTNCLHENNKDKINENANNEMTITNGHNYPTTSYTTISNADLNTSTIDPKFSNTDSNSSTIDPKISNTSTTDHTITNPSFTINSTMNVKTNPRQPPNVALLSDEYVPCDLTYYNDLDNISETSDDFSQTISISSYDSKREPLFPDEQDSPLGEFEGLFRLATTPIPIRSLSVSSKMRRLTVDLRGSHDKGYVFGGSPHRCREFSLSPIDLCLSPLALGQSERRECHTIPYRMSYTRSFELSSRENTVLTLAPKHAELRTDGDTFAKLPVITHSWSRSPSTLSLSHSPQSFRISSLNLVSPPSLFLTAFVSVSPASVHLKMTYGRHNSTSGSQSQLSGLLEPEKVPSYNPPESKWKLIRYLYSLTPKADNSPNNDTDDIFPADTEFPTMPGMLSGTVLARISDDVVPRLAAAVPSNSSPAVVPGTELTTFAMRACESNDNDSVELSKLEARRRFKNRDQRINLQFLRIYAMDYNARVNSHTIPNVGDSSELNSMISRNPSLKGFHHAHNLVRILTMSRDKLWNSVILPPRADPSPQQELLDLFYVQTDSNISRIIRKEARHVPWSGTRGMKPVGARGRCLPNGLAPNSGVTREQYVVAGWCPPRWMGRGPRKTGKV